MTELPSAVAGRTVLIAGATSKAGHAVAEALTAAGARVVAVGSDLGRLDALRDEFAEVATYVCDLADFAAVKQLVKRVHADHGTIDGLIHLVGGWRGGGGLAGQNDEDWDFLHVSVVQTLRNTTRAFNDDLLASTAGRLAIVSSTSVTKPAAGGANYATAKAAAETWVRAVGQGFAKDGPTAATAIFAVRGLAGLEGALAENVVLLWAQDAASLNNSRHVLHPEAS